MKRVLLSGTARLGFGTVLVLGLAWGSLCPAWADGEAAREARFFQGRRVYDRRIQLHPASPNNLRLPDPEEKDERPSPRDREALPVESSLTTPTAPFRPTVIRPRRRPDAEDEEDDSDGLWLLRPVTGVSEESLMAEALTGWGWLAEQVVKAHQQHEGDTEDGEEETEEEAQARLYGLIFGISPEAVGVLSERESEFAHARDEPSMLYREDFLLGSNRSRLLIEDDWAVRDSADEAESDIEDVRRDRFRSEERGPRRSSGPETADTALGEPEGEDRLNALRVEDERSFWSLSEEIGPVQDVSFPRFTPDSLQPLATPLDPAAPSWDSGLGSGFSGPSIDRRDRDRAGSRTEPGWSEYPMSSFQEASSSFSDPGFTSFAGDSVVWGEERGGTTESASRRSDASSTWTDRNSFGERSGSDRESESPFGGGSLLDVPDGSSFRW